MKVQVPCSCYAAVPFEYDEVVDLEQNPEAANSIMSGSFMTVTCPKCGKLLHQEFPFALKHAGKKIDIFFLPERMRDDYLMGKSKYIHKKVDRIAIGFPELAEKLKIINEGLDDVVVEAAKYYLVSKLEADNESEVEIRAFFEYLDEQGNLVFSIQGVKENEVGMFALPKSFYEVTKVKVLAYKKAEPFCLFLTPPYISILRIFRVYEAIQPGEQTPPAEEK